VDEDAILFPTLLQQINEGLSTDEMFGTAEATASAEIMTEAEEVMLSGGVVYKM
jgi:DNA replication licensing factor MCM3